MYTKTGIHRHVCVCYVCVYIYMCMYNGCISFSHLRGLRPVFGVQGFAVSGPRLLGLSGSGRIRALVPNL